MASSPRISTTPVVDDPMYFLPWIVESDVAELRIAARVRFSQECQSLAVPMAPPQLMFNFYRRTFPSPDHPAEHVDSAVGDIFLISMQDSVWEGEAESAFMQATADFLLPADAVLLVPDFCMYISSVFSQLPRTDAVLMDISSLILVSDGSSPINHLQLALPWEEFVLLDDSDVDSDDSDVDSDYSDYGGRPRPASAAAVEGLKTVAVTEEGSCTICLVDFKTEAPVLMMPCGHAFHETCLKEWLGRSHSCPLCRFLLPEAE